MEKLFLFLFSVVVFGVASAQNVFPNFVGQDDSGGNLRRHEACIRDPVREDPSCMCGLKGPGRIYGGRSASKHEYPWMAAVCHYGPCGRYSYRCGGSLINDQFVLTAAHCVWGMEEKFVFVTLGDHSLYMWDEPGAEEYKTSKIIIHKGFQLRNLINDIALIKLDRKVNITAQISPVCMPEPHECYVGLQAILSGWGATRKNGPAQDILKETELTVISRPECLKPFQEVRKNFTLGKTLCTRNPDTNGCNGDSGGPLIFESTEGLYRQIGIVTGGWDCTNTTFPGVYTKVNNYLDFIRSNTRGAKYCVASWLD